MTLDYFTWQIAVPGAAGLAAGLWLRSSLRSAIRIGCILIVSALGVLIWEACTRQPTLLEGLGVARRPDPIQQTIQLAELSLKMLIAFIVSLPLATYLGFVAGIASAIARAVKCTKGGRTATWVE